MQPEIRFLSRKEQEQIHEAALWLLSDVGMKMPSAEAVKIMHAAGAKIDGESIIKIPERLVNCAVEKVPKRKGRVLLQAATQAGQRQVLFVGAANG